MAIVKMKKLRVLTTADRREALLGGLLRLGCVEIGEPDKMTRDAQWAPLFKKAASSLVQARTELADAQTALDAVTRYADVKKGMFTPRAAVTRDALFSEETVSRAREVSQAVGERLREIAALQAEASRLTARRASLLPWTPLDVPLECEGTAHTVFRTGVCPSGTDTGAMRVDLSQTLSEVYEISTDKQQTYYFIVFHKADEVDVMEHLRFYNFSVTDLRAVHGTAAENVEEIGRLLAENEKAQQAAQEAIAALAEERHVLQLYVERLRAEESKEESCERLLTDGTVILFEGWANAERADEVEKFLTESGCAWEMSEPTAEENADVPVQLKNNFFTRPLNMVTEMYSLPAYGSVDPNPVMAPFFIFFYGFMMADMGYGLLMMLASIFVMKKAKPNGATMRHMIPLLGLCGVSTFIMGALTGGFFGDLLPQLAMMLDPDTSFTALPALFSPLDDALAVLIGSLAIGVVQIFTGMAISMYRQIKRGEVMAALCNEGAWYLVFALLAGGIVLGQIKIALIAIVVLLVLTQGYGKQGLVGKLMGIGGSIYNNITGYFSDILSYSRLMALMLAGAVIAQVFNTLGAITGNVVTFFIISMIGNALNFALNLLGCYVHDMRLQCLEYFGRFYEDGGRPFRPLAVDPKLVDIIEK